MGWGGGSNGQERRNGSKELHGEYKEVVNRGYCSGVMCCGFDAATAAFI